MRVNAFVVVALLAGVLLPVGAGAQEAIPWVGVKLVVGHEVVEDVLQVVHGEVHILEGGVLELRGTELKFQTPMPIEPRLMVKEGGTLILNGTPEKPVHIWEDGIDYPGIHYTDFRFRIVVEPGGTIQGQHCHIDDPALNQNYGTFLITARTAVEFNGLVELHDCKFSGDRAGMRIQGGTVVLDHFEGPRDAGWRVRGGDVTIRSSHLFGDAGIHAQKLVIEDSEIDASGSSRGGHLVIVGFPYYSEVLPPPFLPPVAGDAGPAWINNTLFHTMDQCMLLQDPQVHVTLRGVTFRDCLHPLIVRWGATVVGEGVRVEGGGPGLTSTGGILQSMQRGALTVEGGTLILKNSTIDHDDGYPLYIHDDDSNRGGKNHIELWNVTHNGRFPTAWNDGATYTGKYVSRAEVYVRDHAGDPVAGAVVQVRAQPGSSDPAPPGLPTSVTTGSDGRAGFWATYLEGSSGSVSRYRTLFLAEYDGITATLDTSKPHTVATLVLAEPTQVVGEGDRAAPGLGVAWLLLALAALAAAAARTKAR